MRGRRRPVHSLSQSLSMPKRSGELLTEGDFSILTRSFLRIARSTSASSSESKRYVDRTTWIEMCFDLFSAARGSGESFCIEYNWKRVLKFNKTEC